MSKEHYRGIIMGTAKKRDWRRKYGGGTLEGEMQKFSLFNER